MLLIGIYFLTVYANIYNSLCILFPQAKNRELMKQVAALSKGKKFDRTGSSLLLP